MPRPEIGQLLPRAADVYVDDEKWRGYVLAETGHGPGWRRRFGSVDSNEPWSILAAAVLASPVTELRDHGPVGMSCRVPVTITISDRTARVRTVWHYEHDEAAPRLVTAYPSA
jgi:hypothetical protein